MVLDWNRPVPPSEISVNVATVSSGVVVQAVLKVQAMAPALTLTTLSVCACAKDGSVSANTATHSCAVRKFRVVKILLPRGGACALSTKGTRERLGYLLSPPAIQCRASDSKMNRVRSLMRWG